jgi:hypothetical protein
LRLQPQDAWALLGLIKIGCIAFGTIAILFVICGGLWIGFRIGPEIVNDGGTEDTTTPNAMERFLDPSTYTGNPG